MQSNRVSNVSCALFTLFPLAIPIISIENIARKSTKNSMIYINVFAGVLLNFLLALFNIFFLPLYISKCDKLMFNFQVSK